MKEINAVLEQAKRDRKREVTALAKEQKRGEAKKKREKAEEEREEVAALAKQEREVAAALGKSTRNEAKKEREDAKKERKASKKETMIRVIVDDLASTFEGIMKELGGKNHCLFGDLEKIVGPESNGTTVKMTREEITDVLENGDSESFYTDKNVWCYLCIRPEDWKNYMFSPADRENRVNNFKRMREGVFKFYEEEKFDIYVMH